MVFRIVTQCEVIRAGDIAEDIKNNFISVVSNIIYSNTSIFITFVEPLSLTTDMTAIYSAYLNTTSIRKYVFYRDDEQISINLKKRLMLRKINRSSR